MSLGSWEGGGGAASNNALKWYSKAVSCNLKAAVAEAKAGGIALTLDAAGFIPGEGIVSSFFQSTIATGSFINSTANQDATGMVGGAIGSSAILGGIAHEAGFAWAKAIPVVGWGVNTIATAHDLWNTISSGFQAYNACMSKP
jgi:hypothetical protein